MRVGTHDGTIQASISAEYGRLLDMRDFPTVLDCGAHVGYFTQYALGRGADHVIAVEPDSRNFKILSEKFADHPNVTLLCGAVTDAYRDFPDVRVYYGRDPDATSIVKGYTFSQKPGNWAPAISFTELVGEVRPHLIKIDIEGAEHRLDFSKLPNCVIGVAMEVHWETLGSGEFPERQHHTLLETGFTPLVPFERASKHCHVPIYARGAV